MENEFNLSRTKLHENAMICMYQHLFYSKMNKECKKIFFAIYPACKLKILQNLILYIIHITTK